MRKNRFASKDLRISVGQFVLQPFCCLQNVTSHYKDDDDDDDYDFMMSMTLLVYCYDYYSYQQGLTESFERPDADFTDATFNKTHEYEVMVQCNVLFFAFSK